MSIRSVSPGSSPRAGARAATETSYAAWNAPTRTPAVLRSELRCGASPLRTDCPDRFSRKRDIRAFELHARSGCYESVAAGHSIAVLHLFRVILPVSDIEVAASFYARLLRTSGKRVSTGRHYFDCGGTILACYDAPADGDREPVGPNPQHVYFSVDDLDGVYARAENVECRELTPIEVRPWGERSFYARDPFDNPICFVDSQTLFTADSTWAGTPDST
jgi:uncharacterized glyoxalase superfamily protein PhnB